MRRILIALVAVFLATPLGAQVSPQGPRSGPFAMELGTEFTTLFVSCGTPITPICPQWLEPLGRPFLIHYIVAGGRSTDLCSAFIMIKRASPGGGEEIFELFRLVFAEGTGADNVAITLPKPIRVREDDVVGVSRAQGTCAILGKLGIEYTK